jgi:alpha-beta hydrolase superfamily lysophospholipase
MIKKIEFYSEGSLIIGNIYLPNKIEENKKLPGLVLCHGFAGIKELLLPCFAERFSENGFIVLTFDYRGFGESEGEKGRISPTNQIVDIRNAITFLRSLPETDKDKIGLWGTSYGGANAIATAARDKRIKCLVVQLTFGDGERVVTAGMGDDDKKKLVDTLAKVWSKTVTSNRGLMVPLMKVLSDEQSQRFYEKYVGSFPALDIRIPLLTTRETIEHKPEKLLPEIDVPILIVGAENDKVNPVSESLSLFEKANEPKELYIVKNAEHYQVYEGEKFEEVAEKELAWLNRFLK